VPDAFAALGAACAVIEGVSVYTDPGANINLPAVQLGFPELTFETYSTSDPTTATFEIACVVASDGYTLTRLWPFTESVIDAIYGVTDAVVTGAIPRSVTVGGTQLPAYILTCEVSL
jgi:hypothetical protein